MEKNLGLEKFWSFGANMSDTDIKMMNALSLAYIGDGVFELIVRTGIIDAHKKSHVLHVESSKKVKASAQRAYLEKIEAELTEEESTLVRRAKNAKSHTVPKNADLMDYKLATAFEALIGYLYLLKRFERISDLMKLCGVLED